MRWLLLLAACHVDGEPPDLVLECAGGGACVEPTIGVGGVIWGNDELASESAAVRVDDGGLIGSEVGDAFVVALADDEVVARGTVHVAALTNLVLGGPEGPYYDDESDGIYRVPAEQDVGYSLHPMIGAAPSQGVHYYGATIDGDPELCTYQGYFYCTQTPVYDGFALNVQAGNHVLHLHALDGGRDFTFRIVGY